MAYAGLAAMDPEKDAAAVLELLRLIRSTRGIERARTRAQAFHDGAVAALERLPARSEREALREIADFVVHRGR